MVIEVTAYQADDGSIHSSKLAAAKHDAYTKLSALGIFNHASALAVVEHAASVTEALEQVYNLTDIPAAG